jgi:hypothetical protein
MTYGTSAYGSTSIGGSSASEWYVFFPYGLRAADVLFESQLNLSFNTGQFSVFTRQGSEVPSGGSGVVYKLYTSNDPGETPQLQVTQEGDGQNVIPAALFITVTAEINGTTWPGGQFFVVRGRAGS